MAERRVLLTRPEAQSREVARALARDGIPSLVWPLTRIEPAAEAVDIPPGTGGLLFTSANGVRAFAALSPLRDLPALCVGDRTAAAARAAGFADARSAGGDVAALAGLARGAGIGALLHLRGADAAGDLAGSLAGDGLTVAELVLYRAAETGPPPPEVARALDSGAVALVTAWSPRAARILSRHLAGRPLGRTGLLAISQAAADPLSRAGFAAVMLAKSPSGDAMLDAIRNYFSGKRG